MKLYIWDVDLGGMDYADIVVVAESLEAARQTAHEYLLTPGGARLSPPEAGWEAAVVRGIDEQAPSVHEPPVAVVYERVHY